MALPFSFVRIGELARGSLTYEELPTQNLGRGLEGARKD